MIKATGPAIMAPMGTIVWLDKDPTLQKGLENIVKGVVILNALCRKKGIKLVVYLFPSADQVYWDDIVSTEPRYQQYDPMKPNRYIVEKLSAKNIGETRCGKTKEKGRVETLPFRKFAKLNRYNVRLKLDK